MTRAGVAKVDRVVIDSGALAAAVSNGANLVDLVAYHVAEALTHLDAEGADIIAGHTVVSIGRHPDFPGGVTVEAKAGTLKAPGEIAVEPVDEDDLDDSDDGLLASP